MSRKNWYRVLAGALFAVEVLIATKLAHWTFVRWSLGDVLATAWLYCAVLALGDVPRRALALGVFVFACLLEFAQGLQLAQALGLDRGSVLRILLGDSFSWSDIACYLVGTLVALSLDRLSISHSWHRGA